MQVVQPHRLQCRKVAVSRLNYVGLALEPRESKAARNYLGMSQLVTARESKLPADKLKRFEAESYIPPELFLSNLRKFYEGRGYDFGNTEQPGAKAKEAGRVFPAGVVGDADGAAQERKPIKTPIHHMRIAVTDETEMGLMLDLIELNEEHAAELLRKPVELSVFTLFAGISEETRAGHAQALMLLAENGAMFARLFGRDLGGKPDPAILDGTKKPETLGELLHRAQSDMHRALAGDRDAQARKKASERARSVLEAIGLS
jgi:hypothetical protein